MNKERGDVLPLPRDVIGGKKYLSERAGALRKLGVWNVAGLCKGEYVRRGIFPPRGSVYALHFLVGNQKNADVHWAFRKP